MPTVHRPCRAGLLATVLATTLTAAPSPVRAASPVGPLQTGLSITVPTGPVSFGATTPGGTLTGHLGTVQVDDDRLLGGSWTTSVTATSFKTGAGDPTRTIDAGHVSYWSGPATLAIGTLAVHPGQRTAADAVTLDVSRVAFRADLNLLFLSNVAWNPSLVIATPSAAVAGHYTGTVIHSAV
ncbi:hypothetical protein O7598_18665 [Micromonospora sp. WMMC241]|uniref:hypothetical protein n=1 Tax=Micromonospora sp. WMMC241 TaxID=3015159 RepID=UPI0022B645B0|nr:hypothetical protein [Micromonospora sp. WMMC241]MCZ7438438.1 hypothetical protein [Micromonospora sp. WMMC241]